MTHPAERARPSRIARVGWTGLGLVFVAIGAIGIVIPGLPTTVFFIAAAWCFSRSNPRLEQWVLDLPRIGPMVRDYRAGLGMPRRAKLVASVTVVLMVGASAYVLRDTAWLSLTVIVAGVVGVSVINFRVPTRERVVAEAELSSEPGAPSRPPGQQLAGSRGDHRPGQHA